MDQEKRQQDHRRLAAAHAFAALQAGHNMRVPRRPRHLQGQLNRLRAERRLGDAKPTAEVPREAVQYYHQCEEDAIDRNAESIYAECASTTALASYGKTAWQFFTKQERRDIINIKKQRAQLPTQDPFAKRELNYRIDDLGDPEQSYDNGRGNLDTAAPIGNPEQGLEAKLQNTYEALCRCVIDQVIFAPGAGTQMTQDLYATVQDIMGGTVNVCSKLQIAALARVVFPQRDLGAHSPTMTRFMRALDAQLSTDGLTETPNHFTAPAQAAAAASQEAEQAAQRLRC